MKAPFFKPNGQGRTASFSRWFNDIGQSYAILKIFRQARRQCMQNEYDIGKLNPRPNPYATKLCASGAEKHAPTMAIMIGIQGSGKSTFCKEHLSGFTRISLDELHTRSKETAALEKAIQDHCDIVVDNTNPTIEERKRYLELAKANGYKIIGYFMQSKIRDCIERNRTRTGKARVPDTAVAATSNKLQIPSPAEGFDKLYYISITENGFQIDEWRTTA